MKQDKQHLFKGDGLGLTHSTKPHCFKIPDPYDRILRSLPNKSDFLREAVMEKLERDGLLQPID
jgi:hypothetical protein